MWEQDIGRYGASNYALLKVIFEVNLKLFEQNASKKLVFVIRDFDSNLNPESVQDKIEKDIR